MKSFIRFPHSIKFFLQQIEVVVFSWSFTLQQFIHIFVFLYHIISVQFTFAYCSTRTSCTSLPYRINFLQHTLMSCLSLSLPDAQFPSFSILFLLCAFKHCSLALERAHGIQAFFYVLSNGRAVFWIKPLSPVSSVLFSFKFTGINFNRCSSVKDFKGWMYQCMHLFPHHKNPTWDYGWNSLLLQVRFSPNTGSFKKIWTI